jgi:hypothetical protein
MINRATRDKLLADIKVARIDTMPGGLPEFYGREYNTHSEKHGGADFLPGSLCELEMIQEHIGNADVFVLHDDWEPKPIEGESGDTSDCELLDSPGRFVVEIGGVDCERHKLRRVKPWRAHQIQMVKEQSAREDFLSPEIYFFQPMRLGDRPVKAIYFNKRKRRVFFRLAQ